MKTKHLNYSQKFLAVLIIATSLVSIAWLNPAKGKSNETVQKKLTEKKQLNSSSNKLFTAIDSAVVENDPFKQQLDRVIVDTTDPSIPAPPAPPSPAQPEAIPAPAPVAPEKPVAPLSPLKGDLSADMAPTETTDQYTFNYSFQKDSTPVNVNSKVHVNTSTNVNTTVKYDKYTQVDKEEIRKQVREAQRSIQEAMKQLKEVDMKKVQADIQAATKNIDWKNISEETRKAQAESVAALKNIDWDQINKAQAEAAAALKNIDFAAINKNIALAYKSMDVKGLNDKMRKELDESRKMAEKSKEIASAQMTEVRKHRAEALKDAAKAREEAGKAREQADKAREEAGKAKVEAEGYRDMIRKMAADKLLDTNKDYNVENNNNGLFINGVKQPDNIAAKYSKFLKSKHLIIKGSSDSYNINIEN